MSATPGNPAGRFSRMLGIVFEQREAGYCRAHVPVTADLLNAGGVLHGGVHYALADTTMGAAVVDSLEAGRRCATLEIKINYLRAVTDGRLDCETRMVHRGSRTAVLESELTREGVLVAKALGTYAIFRSDP